MERSKVDALKTTGAVFGGVATTLTLIALGTLFLFFLTLNNALD